MKILKSLGLPPLPSTNSETISALLWAREVLQKHTQATYAVRNQKGIEELKPVSIGGVDQWIHIRGRNRDNPVLLYLHGGPGSSMLGLMDAIQRPWEDYFTVVHWDQRQTGKSYYPADDGKSPLCLEQFIGDTEEVIKYLRDYLKIEKLFILGHSWGSVLGMHIAKRYPDWLYAYVGIGQVVSTKDGERIMCERLLTHAKKQNEEQIVSRVEAILSSLDVDNPDLEKIFVENGGYVRKELSRLAGETGMHDLFWDDAAQLFSFDSLISPHLTITDLCNSTFGDEVAVIRPPYVLTKDFVNINLVNDLGNLFEVPVFFFSGGHDWHTPVSLSDEWFNQIESPYKELIHFNDSCHFVINEEPGRFLNALVARVLPFSDAENSREDNNV